MQSDANPWDQFDLDPGLEDNRSVQLIPFTACLTIGVGSTVTGLDVLGVTTRYAGWRYWKLKAMGRQPNPAEEPLYVSAVKRAVAIPALVFVPLGFLGAFAAAVAGP